MPFCFAKNSSFFFSKIPLLCAPRLFQRLLLITKRCVSTVVTRLENLTKEKNSLLSTNGGSCERKNCREKILEGSRIFFYSTFRENFFGRRFRSDKKRICARMMPRNDSPQEGITNPCGFERHQSPLIVLSQLFLRKKAGGEHT